MPISFYLVAYVIVSFVCIISCFSKSIFNLINTKHIKKGETYKLLSREKPVGHEFSGPYGNCHCILWAEDRLIMGRREN